MRLFGERLTEVEQVRRFKTQMLPHLNAAYQLARWLVRDEDDARDLVQKAYLSAFNAFAGFRGEDGKAWILTIVRHACYRWLRHHKTTQAAEVFDETLHSLDETGLLRADAPDHDPETWLLREESQRLVQRALDKLPPEFKEIIMLRELEGYSYREIADIVTIPAGTVMSRLARARALLRRYLTELREES